MDGHFVPNISFGASVMKSLDTWETSPYDVHLMIENPDQYISDFVTEKTEFIVVKEDIETTKVKDNQYKISAKRAGELKEKGYID